MKKLLPVLRVAGAVSLASAAAMAQASIVTYSTQASYLAAISNSAVDTFIGLPLMTNNNLTRTVGGGAYSYSASETSVDNPSSTNKSTLGVGTTANPALTAYFYGATLVLNNFSSGSGSPIQAIGGNFYNSYNLPQTSSGTFIAGNLLLTALDDDGTSVSLTITEKNNKANTFFGFVSTTGLQSLTITPGVQGDQSPDKATVDNLTLGANLSQSVPEPGTAGLVLAGLVAACRIGRRRMPA